METVIKKFGGTSIGSIDRIRRVADILQQFKSKNPASGLIAVVSAMAGETNKLLALAHEIAQHPDEREVDALLSTGEQVTASLLAMELNARGIPSRSFVGAQAKIFTDGDHRQAKITEIDTHPLIVSIERNEIPIVTGFQGIDPEGDITTLGRGGSDISAVALAAALKSRECHIYTDVPGILSADPRIVPTAKLLSKISHEEMLELASLGAKVLHPRSVYFAMGYGVPLVVRSTFEEGEGTWIVPEDELMERPIVSGITYRTDETKILLKGVPSGSSSLERIFTDLAESSVFVDMITQTGTSEGKTEVSFTVLDEHGKQAVSLIQKIAKDLKVQEVVLEPDIAKVSIVGVGMRYHSGVASRVFKILSRENIDVQMISTSEIKISLVVARKYCERVVKSLHEAFSGDVVVEK